jgi:hypothetical protein
MPLVKNNQRLRVGDSPKIINLMEKLLFTLSLCAGLLLSEKCFIRWMKTYYVLSYDERGSHQDSAEMILLMLYNQSGQNKVNLFDDLTENSQTVCFLP